MSDAYLADAECVPGGVTSVAMEAAPHPAPAPAARAGRRIARGRQA